MKANIQKNFKNRYFYFLLESKKLIWRFIFLNLLSTKELYLKKNFFFSFFNGLTSLKKISKVRIKNKCVLTGRNRAINKTFSLSRIQLRSMLRVGLIPGFKKAVW
jgi:ribosomal protein S14